MKLFEETRIGSMTLRNRIVRTAMGDHGADAQGRPGESDIEGYRKVAAGGVGCCITGYSWVCDYPMGGRARMLGAYDDSLVGPLSAIPDALHAGGCAAVQQLVHVGSATACEGVGVVGPSAVEGPNNGQVPREMGEADIARVTRAFADAAVRAKAAGFDGVEVHAAHRFLISQFLSPAYNRRTDAYGGSDGARARLASEVCAAIRAAVGPDWPVMFKVSCDDGVEGGITESGLIAACRALEEAGASALAVSGAWMNYKQDAPYFLEQTIAVSNEVGIPVMLVGGVRGREEAERVVAETPIQLVGFARPFTKDPSFPNEWKAE